MTNWGTVMSAILVFVGVCVLWNVVRIPNDYRPQEDIDVICHLCLGMLIHLMEREGFWSGGRTLRVQTVPLAPPFFSSSIDEEGDISRQKPPS